MSREKTSQSAAWSAALIGAAIFGCAESEAAPNAGESEAEIAVPTEAAKGDQGNRSAAVVRPGIEVLLTDSLHLVRGRRVGLITNQTGIDRAGRTTIDLLHEHPEIELVALFGPEHGIRGVADPGESVDDGFDDRTGVPVFSLYGATYQPRPEMLEGIDVLIFDIQDIGARYFTYISTMTVSMDAAAAAGVPFLVLDRPNPLGGAVQGNVLDPAFATFVGRFPIAMRYGMTPAEIASYYAAEFGEDVDLLVAPVDGWTRDMSFAETGLPWVKPSPNMPDIESATHYPGTCLFEGTNLSVGRGTERAFQQIGAPWLDAEALVRAVESHGLPGFAIQVVDFIPVAPGDGKFDGERVHGIRLTVTDPETYDPTSTAIVLLIESKLLAGDAWEWNAAHFDRLAGTDALRSGIDAGLSFAELTAGWAEQRAAFEVTRARHLIYEQ